MATSRIIAAAAALALPAALAGATLPALASSARPAAAPATLVAAARPAAGWQCRTSSAPVTPNLTGSGAVCGLFDGRNWRGKATLTLTATGRTVTGNVFLGPNHLPVTPGGGRNQDFTVRPGRPVTLTLTDVAPAGDQDTGVFYTAGPTVSPAPGSGALWTAQFSSPLITRTARTLAAVETGPVVPWTCDTQKVTGSEQKVEAKLCVRRVHGYVESSGTFTWTGSYGPSIITGVALDGVGAVDSQPILPASPGHPTTVTLPVTRTALLGRDDTAEAYLRVWPSRDQAETRFTSGQLAIG